MVTYVYLLRTWETETEGFEMEAILYYTTRVHIKRKTSSSGWVRVGYNATSMQSEVTANCVNKPATDAFSFPGQTVYPAKGDYEKSSLPCAIIISPMAWYESSVSKVRCCDPERLAFLRMLLG